MNKAVEILNNHSEIQALILIKSASLRKKYEDLLIDKYVYNLSISEMADKYKKAQQTISNELREARKRFCIKLNIDC